MRRRVDDEPVKHERWLVSYADFITLLFAFFVVMYSISQVNEAKYRVLSDTLTDAFHVNPNTARSLKPIQVGEQAISNPVNLIELNDAKIASGEGAQDLDASGEQASAFEDLTEQLEKTLSGLVDNQQITLRGNEEWLELELSSSLLFDTGNAELTVPALEILSEIASLVKNTDNPIRVEGFTDNVPIRTAAFPSNWELSAARASAVVQLFVEEGVAPSRLAAVGYGEFQPIADNNSVEGRNKNRRVVLMLSKTGLLRPTLPNLREAAKQQEQVQPQDDLRGVETIELEDGGLLFTNDPERANILRP